MREVTGNLEHREPPEPLLLAIKKKLQSEAIGTSSQMRLHAQNDPSERTRRRLKISYIAAARLIAGVVVFLLGFTLGGSSGREETNRRLETKMAQRQAAMKEKADTLLALSDQAVEGRLLEGLHRIRSELNRARRAQEAETLAKTEDILAGLMDAKEDRSEGRYAHLIKTMRQADDQRRDENHKAALD